MSRLSMVGLVLWFGACDVGDWFGGDGDDETDGARPRGPLVPLTVEILHRSCVDGASHLGGASRAQVKVMGDLHDVAFADVVKVTAEAGVTHTVEVEVMAGDRAAGWGVAPPLAIPASAKRASVKVMVYPYFESVPAGTLAGPCARMTGPRSAHSAAMLHDGRVLIAGGRSPGIPSGPQRFLDSAETYDPRSGAVSPVAPMSQEAGPYEGRAFAPAVGLVGGAVLLAGGAIAGDGDVIDSAHALVHDPSAGTWTRIPMVSARRYATATLLRNGTVFVTGGVGDAASGGQVLASTEIFNPGTQAFTPGEDLSAPLAWHTMTSFTTTGALAFAGGLGPDGRPSDLVMAFDTGDGRVRNTTRLAVAVVGAGVVGVSKEVLAYGGATDFRADPGATFEGQPAGPYAAYQTWPGNGMAIESSPDSFAELAPAIRPCALRVDGTRAFLAGGLNALGRPSSAMYLASSPGAALRVGPVGNPEDVQSLHQARADLACLQVNDRQVVLLGGLGGPRGEDHLDTIEIFSVRKLQ